MTSHVKKNNLTFIWPLATTYLCSILFGSILALSFFRLGLFSNSEYLYNRPLIIFFLAASLTVAILIYLKKYFLFIKFIVIRDLVIIFILIFFLNFNAYGAVIFNVTRSNSILMMGFLYKNKDLRLTQEQITEHVRDKYFIEYAAIPKRLNEQLLMANLTVEPSGYQITKRGITLIEILHDVTKLYHAEPNLLEMYINNDGFK
jgi:hypothetical protein